MILLLDLVIFAGCLSVLLFIIMQVVVPLIYGTPLFPLFHSKSESAVKLEEAETQLEELAEQERLKALNEEIERRKSHLKDMQ